MIKQLAVFWNFLGSHETPLTHAPQYAPLRGSRHIKDHLQHPAILRLPQRVAETLERSENGHDEGTWLRRGAMVERLEGLLNV